MRQMKRQRKNRGFSLVELIVVVLIMGIIAVSLAPQVMKWVGKSKTSVDYQSADGLKSAAQVAVAMFESTGVTLADEEYNIVSTGVVVAGGGADANTGMRELLEEYLENTFPKVQAEDGKIFQIQLTGVGCKVTITTVAGTY